MFNFAEYKEPSEHIKQRANRLFVTPHGLEFKVISLEDKPASPRVVRFLTNSHDELEAECREFKTKGPRRACDANYFGSLCAHVHAVVKFQLRDGRRKLKKESRDEAA